MVEILLGKSPVEKILILSQYQQKIKSRLLLGNVYYIQTDKHHAAITNCFSIILL